MENQYIYFGEALNRLLNKAIAKEMVPRMMDSGELLYRIELHVIVAVGEHKGVNLTELAKILGVTKGAVSQKVKLLEKKQFIERYQTIHNKKEVLFKLTPRGAIVLKHHSEFHKKLNIRISKILGNFEADDINKVIDVFKIIEKHLETI